MIYQPDFFYKLLTGLSKLGYFNVDTRSIKRLHTLTLMITWVPIRNSVQQQRALPVFILLYFSSKSMHDCTKYHFYYRPYYPFRTLLNLLFPRFLLVCQIPYNTIGIISGLILFSFNIYSIHFSF